MPTYKFYRSQVTGAGYLPQGDCLATLDLDEERKPSWTEVDPEFERVCLPWFGNPRRMGVIQDPEPLKPYSEEAMEHLSKHQLPSQGFVMVTVTKAEPIKPYGFHQTFFRPPGL